MQHAGERLGRKKKKKKKKIAYLFLPPSLARLSLFLSDHNSRILTNKKKPEIDENRYAPLVLIQLALVEASALLPRAALACVAAFFVGARLLHASAMAYSGPFERRVQGTKGTFLSIAVLSSCCVVAAVKAVL